MKQRNLELKVKLALIIALVALMAFVWYLAEHDGTKVEQSETVTETTNVDDETSDTSDTSDTGTTGISTYDIEHKAVTGDAIKELQDSVVKNIESLRNNTTYLQVLTGADIYNMYVYNKSGEIYSQMSDGTNTSVFRTDGSLVRYNEENKTLAEGVGIDILRLAKNAVEAIGKHGIQAYEMVVGSDTEVDVKEYRVDVIGDEAVKELYKSVNDEYAESMVIALKSQVNYLTGAEDNELHLVFCYRFTGDALMMCCYTVVDNQELLNWKTDAYAIMGNLDWKLDEVWYSSDIENVSADEAFELKNGLVKEMSDLLDEFTADNRIPEKSPEGLDINGMMQPVE